MDGTNIKTVAVSPDGQVLKYLTADTADLEGSWPQTIRTQRLFEPLASYLESFEWRPMGHYVRVISASLGDNAGAIGAAYHAISRTHERPVE